MAWKSILEEQQTTTAAGIRYTAAICDHSEKYMYNCLDHENCEFSICTNCDYRTNHVFSATKDLDYLPKLKDFLSLLS